MVRHVALNHASEGSSPSIPANVGVWYRGCALVSKTNQMGSSPITPAKGLSRIMVNTSAFQADDEGSIPFLGSIRGSLMPPL